MLNVILKCMSNAVNFMNEHIMKILPFSLIFFITSIFYIGSWFAMDSFATPACINDNYLIKLFVCNLYLNQLGKHIVATMISALSIIPFAALLYYINKITQKQVKGITQSLVGSYKGIIKIITFRTLLTLVVFLPLILFLVLGADLIKSNITDTGRMTIDKLLSYSMLPLTLTILIGFFLLTLAEPVFQYVEYEMLINNLRLRDAMRKSYNTAMKHKFDTFMSAFMFVGIWYLLIIFKYLYLINNYLCIVTFAAIFFESMAIFPLRTIYLYFLWNRLNKPCPPPTKVK
jgi:hypothetical protein